MSVWNGRSRTPKPGPATSTSPPESASPRLDAPSGKWIIAATVLGSGLAGIDATVVNIALPALGTDLHADMSGLQWTITSYTLTLAALILLGGSLGDRFGRRRVFVIGIIWFALASALCALAPTIEVLVAARALQGVGGALLTPGSLAIIAASFDEPDRSRAIGVWSGFAGVASAVGPFIGGYLVAGPGWRWVFLINLPLAVVVIAIALRHVPESRDPSAAPHLDLAGAVLGAVGLAGITYALIEGALVAGVVGVLALAAFVVNEVRSPAPMVPPAMFKNRQFTAANLVTLLVYAALGGVFFLLVVNLQVVAGFSPLLAGTALLPVTVIMLLLSERAGAMAGRIGPRLPMTLGPMVAALGLLLLLRIGPGASYVTDVLPGMVVFGLGLALLVAPLTATVLGAAEPQHSGIASGINNAVARAAGLLAVAILPSLVGITGDAYHQPDAFAAGFRSAMLICSGLLIAGGVLAGVTIRNPQRPSRVERHFCGAEGPPIHARPAPVASGASR